MQEKQCTIKYTSILWPQEEVMWTVDMINTQGFPLSAHSCTDRSCFTPGCANQNWADWTQNSHL